MHRNPKNHLILNYQENLLKFLGNKKFIEVCLLSLEHPNFRSLDGLDFEKTKESERFSESPFEFFTLLDSEDPISSILKSKSA